MGYGIRDGSLIIRWGGRLEFAHCKNKLSPPPKKKENVQPPTQPYTNHDPLPNSNTLETSFYGFYGRNIYFLNVTQKSPSQKSLWLPSSPPPPLPLSHPKKNEDPSISNQHQHPHAPSNRGLHCQNRLSDWVIILTRVWIWSIIWTLEMDTLLFAYHRTEDWARSTARISRST